jgi:nickel/cobalt transporter (NiCoT) family protein
MTLFDTLDGCFMNVAYGWAFAQPVRKLYYNLTVTGLSVAVAFLIGTIELGGVLVNQLELRGALWDRLAAFDLNTAGYLIAGVFVAVWTVALAVWRWGRIEERWTSA